MSGAVRARREHRDLRLPPGRHFFFSRRSAMMGIPQPRRRKVIQPSRSRARVAVALAVLAMHVAPALAQGAASFPTKPIQFIVTSPPGGSNDVFARAIGKRLTEAFGKAVVIDNRSGATGSIGAAYVANAAPDGHTILMISSSFTTNAAVQKSMPFDPVKSFAPVAMIGKGPLLLAVSPHTPVKTPEEFFALARAQPGKLNFASSGSGSINHFATELLNEAAGITMTHVPYKGMGPAVNDLIAGHVDVLIASAPSMLAQVKGGKVKGIGVTTLGRSQVAPELPALAAAGAKGYDVELWWGVLAPAGTPKDVVAKLNAEINKALATEEMRGFLVREGAEPAPMSAEAFTAVVHGDIDRWKKVAQTAGIRGD
jgi:tripartite-type tricarboxylate transporter receptor subunit TctC